MIETFTKKAEEYLDSAVELLSQLIAFPSVQGEAEENAPFGKDCAAVLGFAQKTLEKDFYVRNFDNYAITASFNDQPAELGILAHLDVVPVNGQDWTTPPFKADIRDGRIYGRGSIDDKGPAAAVITAMRIIKDMGLPIKRNVRLILGSNEENGSADMEYYLKKEAFPPMLFTPDADFPLITVEKGMIRYSFSGTYGNDSIVSLRGGSVVNAVPEKASALVNIPIDEVKKSMESGSLPQGASWRATKKDRLTEITVEGKGAHASTPENGVNALTFLLEILSSLPVKGELSDVVRRLSAMYPFGETDGSHAGIKCSDERSGELTSLLSIAECADGKYEFLCDTRFPVSKTSAEIADKLASVPGSSLVMSSEGHCADEDSELVRTLLSVYEDCTGKKGECLSTGGGTYVHDTPNGVAFGAQWENINNMHGADEFIGIDELRKDIIIYTEAIYRLAVGE